MYDPIARKVIIIRDVQFVENESWDGTIDINVKIVSNINNDDMEEEVVQIPHVSQPVGAPSTPMTPRHGSAQGPLTQVAAQATPTRTPIKHFVKVDIDRTGEDKKSMRDISLEEIWGLKWAL